MATAPPHLPVEARHQPAAPRVLTETQIRNAKAPKGAIKLADPGGLFLLVQPGGTKLWRYRFWLQQKEGVLALGRYPDVSLKRARELHLEARSLVAEGINPVHHRQQAKLQQIQVELKADLGTFEAVVAAWRLKTDKQLRASTARQREREINNDLLPQLKLRHVESIQRIELSNLLTTVEKRAPETARNLRTHLHAIFEHAIDIGMITANPTPPRRLLQARHQVHHTALPAQRVGNFLRALDASRIQPETRIAMLLVLLTACRKAEVTSSRWEEFDLKAKAWTIPASRMKAKREHWVPLSSQAVMLLNELRDLVPHKCEFLFPNRVDPSRPMANRSLNAVIERLGYGGESTPHGMRAAFSTHFNKVGANVDVIEHCLAHSPADKVRAAYNRHAYQDERRAMLQAWADHLDSERAKLN
ncbi:tyrosine-type recombinase/integrase [Variovorax sp. LT1R20]|uniref:tyrosine-type recombinase/integrase n=1 Tax=Variovorax sp. LT1R20 TaxID=3443729 RepID=UPI003F48F973